MTALPPSSHGQHSHAPYPAPQLGRAHLATVISVSDPDSLGRVQIRLFGADGVDAHDAPLWARVAVPVAGAERGAFLIPDVNDEVLVVFVDADRRFPIVVGSLWNGRDAPPESLPGDRVDRWTFTGSNGTRIAIVEESEGQEQVVIQTPNNATITIAETGSGEVTIEAGGNTVTIDSAGVKVESSGQVEVQASRVSVSAGSVSLDASIVNCSGVVQCSTLVATTVVGSTYTTGAGNVM